MELATDAMRGAEPVRLGEMLPGDYTFTVPWSMWFDLAGKAWALRDMRGDQEPGGTVKLWVARAEEGLLVDIQETDERWRRQAAPVLPAGVESAESLPVIGLITSGRQRRAAERRLRKLGGPTLVGWLPSIHERRSMNE